MATRKVGEIVSLVLPKLLTKAIIHVRFYTSIVLYSGVSVSHAPLRGIIGSTNCMVDRIEL
jgi:hypothetical protein